MTICAYLKLPALLTLLLSIFASSYGSTYSITNNSDYICTLITIPDDLSLPIIADNILGCKTTTLCTNDSNASYGYTLSLDATTDPTPHEILLTPDQSIEITTTNNAGYFKLSDTSCLPTDFFIATNNFITDDIQDGDQYFTAMLKSTTLENVYTTITLKNLSPGSAIPQAYFIYKNAHQCNAGDIDADTQLVTLTDDSSCRIVSSTTENMQLTTQAMSNDPQTYEFTSDNEITFMLIGDEGNYQTLSEDQHTVTGSGLTTINTYYIFQYEFENTYYLSEQNPDHYLSSASSESTLSTPSNTHQGIIHQPRQ